MLNFSVNLVSNAEFDDLVHFSIRAIDQDKILRLSLKEKEFKWNTIHSSLEGQVWCFTFDSHIFTTHFVGKWLSVLLLELFEPVIWLNVGFLSDDVGFELLDLLSLLLIQDQLFFKLLSLISE